MISHIFNIITMIPKIIHYCWFSGDKFPPLIEYCIESWKKYLPDYELKLWNFDSFPREKSIWVQQAVDNKKYAFAADYIRAYALYTEGGIYLDSDVEVLKSFDPLLNRPYFLGRESHNLIEAAVMGAEKGNPLFGKLLDYYSNREFEMHDGNLDMRTLPKIMGSIIRENFTFREIENLSQFPESDSELCIFPDSYFSPKSYLTGETKLKEFTFCIHHFDGGWLNRWEKSYRWVKKHFGANAADTISKLIKTIKK